MPTFRRIQMYPCESISCTSCKQKSNQKQLIKRDRVLKFIVHSTTTQGIPCQMIVVEDAFLVLDDIRRNRTIFCLVNNLSFSSDIAGYMS